MNNKLLLIDTFYFLHRSFHGYPKDFKTSRGEHTNMSFGLTKALFDSIKNINPTHIACGWESEEQPSFRKELYPLYQFTRVSMAPDDEKIFREQIPRIIQILEAFNVPRITENGFEGDDVLGTVARKASLEAEVVIATSDQDILQLIDERVSVYRPSKPPFVKEQIFDEEAFKEKYGFEPIQMIDFKALRGDPSDNIPGVKGVGEKTAQKLLAEYNSIENIYEHLSEIPVTLRTKLAESKKDAFLSKQLATIIVDIPMDFNLQSCEVHDFDEQKIRTILEELEFKSIIKQLDQLMKIKNVKDSLKRDKEKIEKDSQQISLL